jgi:hypothetical protein
MDFRERSLIQHARIHTTEVASLIGRSGLRPERRDRGTDAAASAAGSNSLAWLFWHMSRSEDIGANLILAQTPQTIDSED